MIKAIWRFLTQEITILGRDFSLGGIFLRTLLPIAVFILVYKLLLLLVRKLILRRLRIDEDTERRVYRYVRLALRIAFLLGLLALIFNLFESEDIALFFNGLWSVLTSPLFTAGASQITVVTILLTIPIFYASGWVSRIAKRFMDNSVLTRLSLAEETKFTVSILMRNVVMIVAVLIGLSVIGIDLSTLTILFGVLGIGLGFGLQGTVANFVAGFILVFERPIKEGDRIRVGGMEGDVVQIRFRSTIINTITNETIVVPNAKLVEDHIHNYSYLDTRIVLVNQVQVAYRTDLEKAREVLLGVNAGNPYSLKAPAPEVRVVAFQNSGILMELRTWIKKAPDKLAAESWINFAVWKALRDAEIQIPFPQMDLYVKQLPAGSAGPNPPPAGNPDMDPAQSAGT